MHSILTRQLAHRRNITRHQTNKAPLRHRRRKQACLWFVPGKSLLPTRDTAQGASLQSTGGNARPKSRRNKQFSIEPDQSSRNKKSSFHSSSTQDGKNGDNRAHDHLTIYVISSQTAAAARTIRCSCLRRNAKCAHTKTVGLRTSYPTNQTRVTKNPPCGCPES